MAEPITYREYWTQVEAIGAEAIEEAIASGGEGDEPTELVDDRIWQDIDGHEWIIYNWRLPQILEHTDNEDEFFESMGGPIEGETASDVLRQLAFWAFRRDVTDRLPDNWEEKVEEAWEAKA